MKILKKSKILLVMVILILSVIGGFNNEAKAAVVYPIKEANLYSKGEMVSFTYKGIGIGVQYVVYKKDGIEYPAYCLNKNLVGVTQEEGAKVTVSKAIENVAVWRAVINGYPFKTPEELNCKSDIEAFAATKMAVYDALYTYNWSDFEPLNEQGKRVIEAAEQISKKARSLTDTKVIGEIEIKELTKNWKEDDIEKGYISKRYKIESNIELRKCTVELEGLKINNVKITNKNNELQTEFARNDEFKILIPISELENKPNIDTQFNIIASAELKTKPVLYGETADSNYQNYALAAGEWEYNDTLFKDKYPSNETTIRISKQDAETNLPLANAKFNLLDEDGKIIYTEITTNEKGIAEINGVMPGKYFLQEVKAPEGYTLDDRKLKIDIAFNQEITIGLENYKKPEEEEKETKDKKEINVLGKKEVSLPRTGF